MELPRREADKLEDGPSLVHLNLSESPPNVRGDSLQPLLTDSKHCSSTIEMSALAKLKTVVQLI